MNRPHRGHLLHEHFEVQALQTPEATALHDGDRSITFGDLRSQVRGISAGLTARGIGEGSLVGLHVERSVEWVVGLLAIMSTNAAVVPLPPSYPIDRLLEIVQFAGLDLIIDAVASPLEGSDAQQVVHLKDLGSGGEHPARLPSARPDQAAFVLLSSGSTGRPKMIVRSHRSFFHRLEWTWETHPYGVDEVCCQKAHMTTTHAIYELFEPLLRGVPVVLISDADVRNLKLFWDTIRARGISRLLLVPSALQASLDMPGFVAPALEVLVLMGEYVHPALAERSLAAFPEHTCIYSIYGSTEASSTLACDLRKAYRQGAELPLGTPLTPDLRAMVLGSDLNPVDPGEVGRLYMAGTPLFTEYLRDPDLTKSMIVAPPKVGARVYDTRDQVRLRPDGEIEFIGRVDHTVKVRGFRVDLAEVEREILMHPDVGVAAVVATGRDVASPSLVAFVAPAGVDRSDLFRVLRSRLPAYMVPSKIVVLDEFPLTSSSKIDRRRLLEEYADQEHPVAEGQTLSGTQERIARVWRRVLGYEGLVPGDSFFEVGGTSLSVFALAQGIRDEFGFQHEQLTERLVYQFPTVGGQAARIDDVLSGGPLESAEHTPILVTLRRGSEPERPPFFLIASAGGTLGAYTKLSNTLTTTRDVIGVRDPFNWGERDAAEGFERWVGRYLEGIRERQSTGPYYIGAYSSAGAFGYEIARRLRRDGEEVGLLALIEPLGLARGRRRSFGDWAYQAIWMRPMFRSLVHILGWLRIPAVRLSRAVRGGGVRDDRVFSSEEVRQIEEEALGDKGRLMNFAALLELNTGLPFALSEGDFGDAATDRPADVLRSRLASLMPDVDPVSVERIAVQYELQVRAQHAYELEPYDGPVLLFKPPTPYAGLLASHLRPHVRKLTIRPVKQGPGSDRELAITERFGRLGGHYRSMRDDVFVKGLAEELDGLLG